MHSLRGISAVSRAERVSQGKANVALTENFVAAP
jgi:hypothetical protein